MTDVVVSTPATSIVVQSASGNVVLGDTQRDIAVGTSLTTSAASATGANVGGGDAEVYQGKAGSVLSFRTISGVNGISVAESGDVIEINGSQLQTVLLSHADRHQHGGGDEVATATPAANAIPKADGSGQLDTGWMPTGTFTDEAVGVTAADTTPGYLDAKLVAGAGLTSTVVSPGGDEDLQVDVVANADGSIVVNADDVQVGILATDAQHGDRGGGSLHALAIASGAGGFLSGADKQSIDDLATTYAPILHASTHAGAAGDPITSLGAVFYTGTQDLNGEQVTLDVDGDSYWVHSSDDLVALFLGGVDSYRFVTDEFTIKTTLGINGPTIYFGGNTSTDVRLIRTSNTRLFVQKGDGSDWADLYANNIVGDASIYCDEAGEISWLTRTRMFCTADGELSFVDSTATTFSRLILGPAAASHPSLKRSGTDLEAKLGDDSAYTDVTALDFNLSGTSDSLADHSSRHHDGGSDELSVEALATAGALGTVPTSDGAGGLTMALPAGEVDQARTIYVGKHGNDSADGLSVGRALLTIGAAITAASALTPTQANPVVIRVQDSGVYTEAISVPSWVSIWAPEAKITDSTAAGIGSATVVLAADASVRFKEIEQTSSTVLSSAVYRSNTAGTATAVVDVIRLSNQTIGIFNGSVTGGVLMARAKQVLVDTGWGVGDASSAQGHTHIDIEDLYIAGNSGTGISRFGAGSTVGRVTHILELGSPTTTLGLFCSAGSLDLTIDTIETDTAWNIAVGGTMRLTAQYVSGTRTNAGTVHVFVTDESNDVGIAPGVLSLGELTRISAPADGRLLLTDAAGTDFDRIELGGSSASFPAIERSSADLRFRLGDDSDWAKQHTGHIGITTAPTATHLIFGDEFFDGSANRIGIGMFPAYIPTTLAANNLYGMQGNVFFGGANWAAGSTVNCLQFFPAPDYTYGAVSWGSSNLNLLGIGTGGMINIFGRTVTCDTLIGIGVTSFAHIFGAPGAVTANRASGIEVQTPSQTTGTIGVQCGVRIEPQLYATTNQGIWLHGDSAGADLCLGAGSGNNPDARVYYDGSNLIIDPDNLGSGRVLIGATGDDDLLVNDIEIDGDLNHDGSGAGFFGTAPAVQQAALTTALTSITHTGPTTPDYAIATPVDSGAGSAWGFSTQDEFETAMSVIANLQTRVNELETKLQAYGLLL